ncbi:MAG TPA: glycosyltransferase family 87 protein [Gemmatimonadota bacterium]|nr:glycosyltransferase family 87 protein [Gemmatimonadota bacterium]
MGRGGAAESPGRGRRLLHLGLFGLALTAFGLWLGYLWLNRSDPSAWQRDWFCFYSAGERFLETGPVSTYVEQCIDDYFWLYPPYLLYPYALASMLPPLVYYGVAVAASIVLTGSSLKLLAAALPSRSFETIALFVVGSAALFATLVTGQHSALLLVGVAGALWALRDDREFTAGLFLGLVGIKPNWALFFIAWLVVTRRWRTLGGMALVGAAMILSTLPMGLDAWRAYLVAGPAGIGDLLDPATGEYSYPAHKLVTFEAFARSTVGSYSPAAGQVAWVMLELLALVACLSVWLRSPDVRDQLVITVLVAVAANLYVEFYDVLVLAVPAVVWWTSRVRYRPGTWRLIGAAAASIWVWHWIWAVSSPGPGWPSLVGGFLAVWIAAETSRALRPSSG